MIKKLTPQCQLMLGFMLQNGEITGMQAIEELGVMNYKGRICDLRKMGYPIKTRWAYGPNRRGELTKFAVYELCVCDCFVPPSVAMALPSK